MLPFVSQTLDAKIIGMLAEKPAQSAEDLKARTRALGRAYTHQAIYKELNKLRRAGIVVKAPGCYSLKLSWVLEFFDFAQGLYRANLTHDAVIGTLRREGGKSRWRFNDLLAMDDFWGHLHLVLIRHTREKRVFEWVPHQWYEFVHREKEDQYQRALRLLNTRVYLAVGGTSWLDLRCQKHLSKDIYECSYAPAPFAADQATYLDLVGNYVLTVRLNRRLALAIDAFYKSATSPAKFDPARLLELLMQKSSVTVTVEKSALKARRLRRQFEEFFGLATT